MKKTGSEKKAGKIIEFLYYYRFLIINALFILFIILLRKPLLAMLKTNIFVGEVNYFLAFILLLALAIETYAIFQKIKIIGYERAKLPKNKFGKAKEYFFNPGVFSIWAFHMVVGIILIMSLGTAVMGISTENMKGDEYMLGVLFLIELIRNGFIFGLFVYFDKPENAVKKRPSMNQELLADLFLVLFACIAFTSTWNTFMTNTPVITSEGIGYTIFQLIPAFLVFLIFYLPLNMMNILSLHLLNQKRREKIMFWVTVIISTFVSVFFLMVKK